MAVTAATRNSIIELVVTAYNAAPGTALLTDLVEASDGGASLADIATTLTTSDAFKAIYPTFQTATEFAEEFLTNLVPEASAAARAEGISAVEAVLNGGGTRADVILQAQTFLAALSEDDASFGTSAALFNNRVEVATHHTVTLELNSANITDLQNVLASVTSSDDSVQPAKDNAAATGGQQGQTISLTTGADAITGSAANDLIVATESTLSSADVLDGGAGTDTLRYASSGSTAVSESGFESKNIEIVSVTSDAVGGTTFDLSGATGLSTVRNFNSSQNLTVSGLSAITDVTLDDVGSPDNSIMPSTTINYTAVATAGTNTQNVSLISNSNANGGAIGTLTANGVENFTVTTSGSSSSLAGIASTTLDTITVLGDQNLTITGILTGADTVDASAFTGNLSVVLDSATTAKDVVVTGGTGNDTANFSAGFEKDDSFDGGEGTDTLGVLNAVATGTPAGTLKNVEILDVTDAGTGTIDMDNFSGVTKVIYNAGIAAGATATVDDAVSGIEVEVDSANLGTDALVVDLKTDGSADEITLTIDRVTGAHSIASINAADAETLNISFDDDSTANTTASFTVTSLTASDATTLKLSGDATTTISNVVDPTTPVLATIDASGMTGKLTLAGVNTASSGATITLGSNDDTLTFATNSGADTITLGDGKDTLVYNSVAQSDSDTDVIKDFVSGTDKLSFNFANPVISFAGNKESFGQAQGALPGTNTAASGLTAVYQQDDRILWIDIDDNGTLDNNDFRVKFDAAPSATNVLTTADIGLLASGNTITLSAAAAVVNATTKTNADNTSTNFGDTIKSTIARLAGSTIDGGLGTDNLTLTDAGAVGAIPATVTNVETLTLATVGTTANTGVALNDAGIFKTIVGSSNADTIAATLDLIDGGSISLGDGNDTITSLDNTEVAGPADTGVKINVDMGAGDDSVTLNASWAANTPTASTVLNGGSGSSDTLNIAGGAIDISAATVTGFENVTTGAASTMTAAQYAGFSGTITNGGTITVDTAGTLTINEAGNVTFTNATGSNVITIATGATGTITGSGIADSFSGTSAAILATTAIAGGAGTDTVTIDLAGAASAHNGGTDAISAVENLVFTNSGASAVLTMTATDAYGASSIDMSALTSNTVFTGTGLTTATSIKFGSGNETITNLNAGAAAMTVDFGGGNASITDLTDTGTTHAANTNNITLKFGTSTNTQSVSFAATTEDLVSGDVLDFATNVTSVVLGAADGTKGAAGAAGQVFIETSGGAQIVTFDADGNRSFSPGDVQITLAAHAVFTAGIVDGNLVIS